MDTLAATGADAPGIPRFDDGMVNVNELLGTPAEAIVNDIYLACILKPDDVPVFEVD